MSTASDSASPLESSSTQPGRLQTASYELAMASTAGGYLALLKVEFEYAAQSDDELSVTENLLVWLVDNSDPE